MKTIGNEQVLKRGLNFRKALLLLGFNVDTRGKVTPPTSAPAANSQRPVLTPAETAANLRQRRRFVGKQAPSMQ